MSKKMRVIIHKIHQDEQVFGTDDEYMLATVHASISIDGKIHNVSTQVKQVVGDKYGKKSIEVSKPEGYKGQLDYDCFRRGVAEAYTRTVGEEGSGIRIIGASSVTMSNNTFQINYQFECEVPEESSGSW